MAFVSTLSLSVAIITALPHSRQQRQRHFAEAAMDGNLRRMRLLRMAGADVNLTTDCCPPLAIAAREGRIDVVRYLLAQDADVNAREKSGDTALTEAVLNNHLAIVKELLQHGADVNAIGFEGTALDIALARGLAELAELLRHHAGKRACELRQLSC